MHLSRIFQPVPHQIYFCQNVCPSIEYLPPTPSFPYFTCSISFPYSMCNINWIPQCLFSHSWELDSSALKKISWQSTSFFSSFSWLDEVWSKKSSQEHGNELLSEKWPPLKIKGGSIREPYSKKIRNENWKLVMLFLKVNCTMDINHTAQHMDINYTTQHTMDINHTAQHMDINHTTQYSSVNWLFLS